MYHSPTALPPALPPAAYSSEEHWQREQQAVFATSWHLVGTFSQVRKPGDYFSLELLGVPLLVRNFGDEVVALRNVCAHRHSLLVQKPSGCSARLACPYHGWEYGADGRTRKIPAAKNFPHFNREQYCLDRFPIGRCGDLLFIRLSQSGPTFEEWIGDRAALFASWFSTPEFRLARAMHFDYPVNWKIPVEGSLESYHIPAVHPQTFVEDPGEQRSHHFFHATGTSFETQFLTPRWIDRRMRDMEALVMWGLGLPFEETYHHHHVFPNLLISHTNTISVAQVIHPRGPTSSWSTAYHFSRAGNNYGFVPRWGAWLWGAFTPYVTEQILNEDVAIFPFVQQGLQATPRPGLLGRCEERLHALQAYVAGRIATAAETSVGPLPSSCPAVPVNGGLE